MKSKPTTKVKDFAGSDEIVKTHPSFAAIRINRVSGDTQLFGSEIRTGSYIKLEILNNEEIYQHHEKHYYPHQQIIEVNMTHAQFAEAITSLNMGSGIPCTLKRLNGQQIDECIEEDTSRDLIKSDLRKQAREIVRELKDLTEAIEEVKCTVKDKIKLKKMAERASMQIQSNLPFILDQYDEQVDKKTSAAKIDIEAFLVNKLTQLGMDKLNETKLLK